MPWKKGRKRSSLPGDKEDTEKKIIPKLEVVEVSPPLQGGITTRKQRVSTKEEQSLEVEVVQDDLLDHIVPDPRNIPDIPTSTLKLPILPLEEFDGKHVDIDELQSELENMLVTVVKRKTLLMAMNGCTPPPQVGGPSTSTGHTVKKERGRRGRPVVSTPTLDTSEGRSLIRAALVMVKVEPPDIEEEGEPTEEEMENERVKNSFNELVDQYVAEITSDTMRFVQELLQDNQVEATIANPKIEPKSAGPWLRSHTNRIKTEDAVSKSTGPWLRSHKNQPEDIATRVDITKNKKSKKNEKSLGNQKSEEYIKLESECNNLSRENAKELRRLLDKGETYKKYYEVKKRLDPIFHGLLNVQKGMTEIKRSIKLGGDPDGEKDKTLQGLRKEATDLIKSKSTLLPELENLESMLFGAI